MSIISTFKHQRSLKSIWSAFLVLVVVFGLFNGLLVKNALATNNYVDNISLTKGSDNKLMINFHVKTSFNFAALYWGDVGEGVRCYPYSNNPYSGLVPIFSLFKNGANQGGKVFDFSSFLGGSCSVPASNVFIAGNTYSLHVLYSTGILLTDNSSKYYDASDWTNTSYVQNFGNSAGSPYSDFNPNFNDADKYYFIQYPSMTITYPQNNGEIANIFNIQGSFTQPSGDTSHFLEADIMPTGTEISSFQKFWTTIGNNTSGNFSITIGNVPAGYYDFRIYFISGAFDHYQGALISNIHIVNDLPPFIPPWEEQPPTTAPIVYQPLEPIDYYTTQQSTYATPTPLYITLTGTFSPVLLSITGNLQQFASNFTLTNASSTGNQIGQSVLLVRSYLSNFNSFFGNFPVSQFLLLYLIALVVVVVLRLVKGLINLFKL